MVIMSQYMLFNSLCGTPETYTVLHVNYNSIKLGGKRKPIKNKAKPNIIFVLDTDLAIKEII